MALPSLARLSWIGPRDSRSKAGRLGAVSTLSSSTRVEVVVAPRSTVAMAGLAAPTATSGAVDGAETACAVRLLFTRLAFPSPSFRGCLRGCLAAGRFVAACACTGAA